LLSRAEEFLAEVAEGLAGRLPANEIPLQMTEIAAHLDDALEACEEMGWSEAAAVSSMGCPRRLARNLAHEASVVWDHRRLHFAAVALAGYGLNLAGLSTFGFPWLTKLVAVVSVAATFGVAYGAFRARSFRLAAIFALGMVLSIPATLLRTHLFVNMAYPGGRGNSPRSLVAFQQARILRNGSAEDMAELNSAAAEPYLVQASRQMPFAIASSASLIAIVSAVDGGFAVLGLAALAVRRRRRSFV
jgi:MYXO-CTERM domain-containing protein